MGTFTAVKFKKNPHHPPQFCEIGEEFKGLVSAGIVLYTLISAAETLWRLSQGPCHLSLGHPPTEVTWGTVSDPRVPGQFERLSPADKKPVYVHFALWDF